MLEPDLCIKAEIWKQSFADVLQNRCSYKLSKFHKKKPAVESLFNKFIGLQVFRSETLLKKDSNTGIFL